MLAITPEQQLPRLHKTPPLWLVAAVLLGLTITGVLLVRTTQNYAEHKLQQAFINQASIAASNIAVHEVLQLTGTAQDLDSPSYHSLWNQLINIRKAAPMRFAYLMQRRGDKIVFLVDAEAPDSKDHSPPGQPYPNASAALFRIFDDARPFVEGPIEDQWGVWVSASAPIVDPQSNQVVAILGLDVNAQDWQREVQIFCWGSICISALIILLALVYFISLWRFCTVKNDQLRSAAELTRMIDNANAPVVGVDAERKVTVWNRYAQRATGCKSEEVLGKPIIEDLIAESDRATAVDLLDRALQGQALTPCEIQVRTKNDAYASLLVSATPRYDAANSCVGVVCVGQDITQRKEMEQEIQRQKSELQRLVAKLSESNKELEAFSYSVSHDLRAPLRSISGFSEVLKQDYANQLDQTVNDYLNRIVGGTQRMASLIDGLLQLSRASWSEMFQEPVNLSELAKEIRDELQSNPPADAVKFIIHDTPPVKGDVNLLRVALGNLFTNACKYSATVADPTVEFGAERQDDKTVFFIRDNGIGFDMAYASKLFVAFQRLHSDPHYEGSGIGLATVKRVIQRHGGEIWAQSQPDKGAVFYFTLGSEANAIQ